VMSGPAIVHCESSELPMGVDHVPAALTKHHCLRKHVPPVNASDPRSIFLKISQFHALLCDFSTSSDAIERLKRRPVFQQHPTRSIRHLRSCKQHITPHTLLQSLLCTF
jgi:hypothetical protein